MPGGDKTGPVGAGPMTGRGIGLCAGYGMPGYMNPIPGRGFGPGVGWGRGMGRGFRGGRGRMSYGAGFAGWDNRHGFHVPQSPVYAPTTPYSGSEELRDLKNQAKHFNDMLSDINKRIDELTKEREG